jgi:hypothetical protein
MNAHTTSPVPPVPSPSIRIARLQGEGEKFPGIFEGIALRPLQDNAFVIHNDDSRDVVAIYGVWTVMNQDGTINTFEYLSDIYMALIPTLVIPSGKTLIATPNGWIFPKHYSAAGAALEAQSSPYANLASRLTHAASISLSIDALIFADGETCGANTKRLDQAIVARRDAAISLAANARDALTRGEPAVSSEDLFAQSNDKSSEAFWRGHLGGQLSREPDKEPYLRYLESLPRPPAFYASRSTD